MAKKLYKMREKRELENGTNIINSHIKNETENQDEEDFPFQKGKVRKCRKM